MTPLSAPRSSRIPGAIGLCAVVGLAVAAAYWYFGQPAWVDAHAPESVLPTEMRAASVFPPAGALACKQCHADQFQDWIHSQHANANRLVDVARDKAAFAQSRTFREGILTTSTRQTGDDLYVRQTVGSGTATTHRALAVIGVAPLIQYLAAFPNGRLQTINPAFDPVAGDWFDTFRGEPRQAHEWGFWKNQGLNWNSQCAACHMTGFQKNYDIATDSYKSTWDAMGISCAQCHGAMTEHLAHPTKPVVKHTPQQIASNCASCHSRREELTGNFKPGDNFHDHYRLTLPDLTNIYYPDGQVREENFEYASFALSKMGHAGITCLDCHNPHSGKLVLPLENNTMCMSCHTPPGNRNATPIPDVVAHGHHAPGSAGNSCVSCHMPETTYMARDERRDHGFTIPDPQLTKEHGIPNACNRCHSDKTVDWSIEWTQKWYGEKLNRPSRDRARLVARARDGDPDVWREIVKFAATEKNPAWIAVLINVLEPANAEPEVIAFLQQNASHADPLVRTAAVGVLATGPGAHPALETALSDANRNVRMTSAYALATSPRPIPADHRKELEQYLANQSDQPGGAMRQANLAAMEERVDDARTWLTRAAKMDPSTGIHDRTARILYTINDLPGARAAFQRAISGESPSSESFYSFALLEAEAGNEEESIRMLRECVTRDPTFGRAWYNLSLAEAGRNNLRQAIPAMEKAVMLSPRDPSPSYALATLHLRMQNPDAALAAAKRALEISPTHGEAKRLVEQLSRE